MKISVLLLFLLGNAYLFAQMNLPVVKANSTKASIVEGENDRYSWSLNPHIKPDVHTIAKSVRTKWVKFLTDIDSVKIKLRPNEHFDFIVLLNNKDSCYTRIESLSVKNYSHQRPAVHDTIQFTLTEFNNIKIRAVLNKGDTMDLKFDSGTTGLLLTNDAIRNKTHLLSTGNADNTLQLGNLSWNNLRIYPVELSGQGTDGRFGWDLFDGRIVEIDYDKSLFIVHTSLPIPDAAYSRLNIEYTHTLFCIQGDLQIGNKKYKNRFLFDNGYQRTIMLDTLLMKQQNYPRNLQTIKKVIMKNGAGIEIPVITVNNERLNLGRQSLFDIPVQLMTMGNPAEFPTHIIGNEVLKRFNTFLDFQNNFVYLKPNSLINLPYKDAK